MRKNLLSRIIFLGPPGSGKGTQAQKISKKYKIPHIAPGDIFRKIIKTNKPKKIADKIKNYVQNGLLVPDKIVFNAVKSVLDKKKFLLDGYPRNLLQAKLLDDYLKNKNSVEKVIYFKISDREVVKRLSSRRTCPKCGKIYNIYTLKPKEDNLCDICKVKLIVRKDDKPETVKKRLKVYKKETKPLIEYYKKKNLLYRINAEDNIENIFQKICKLIENN